MSAPNDLVSISQAELNGFATQIRDAVGVLGPYIQRLIAGEQVSLQAADESAVRDAVGSLTGLEPPAPASANQPAQQPDPNQQQPVQQPDPNQQPNQPAQQPDPNQQQPVQPPPDPAPSSQP